MTFEKKGESFERLMLLSTWREVPIYTEQEKAALELTEHVTRVSEAGVPDHVYKLARTYFDEKQYLDLIMAINTINCWNRLSLATGLFPGCFS